MNQTAQVYEYMKKHGSIDAFRAFTDLGILRLSARIWDLKDAHVGVKSVTRYRYDEEGKLVKKWSEYSLTEISENPWISLEKEYGVDVE